MNFNFWKNRRILVTGATGFVGSRFFNDLKNKGVYVIGLCQDKGFLNENNILEIDVLKKVDILNVCQTYNIDTIIHCAALDGNFKFKENDSADINHNVEMVENILDCAVLNNIKDLIIFSSAEVYGFSEEKIFKETDFIDSNKLNNNYALAKEKIEELSLKYIKEHGLNILIPRPNNIYGPGEDRCDDLDRLIPRTIKKIIKGEKVEIVGDGSQKINFLYISDLINIVLSLFERNCLGIFNIGGQEVVSVKDVISYISKSIGKNSDIKFIHDKNGGSFSRVLDISKTLSVFDFKFEPFDSGIKKTVDWYINKDKNKRNLLITAADKNFINQAKQLFASVYLNGNWKGDYMLLSCDISNDDRKWFEDRGVIVYSPPLITTEPLGHKSYPPIILSKLYFFKNIFKKWNKILFLDADILVKYSLDNLLTEKTFAAPKATSFKLINEFDLSSEKASFLRKKYNLHGKAFSTGVFVFDTKLIESKTFSEIMDVYYKFADACQYGEESVLNIFFYKKWNKLPIIYNAPPEYLKIFYGFKKDEIRAPIIHFVCSNPKPWQENSEYYNDWSNNLNKANSIDFRNYKESNNYASKKSERFYLVYLFFRYVIFSTFVYIDSKLGLFGLFLKKKYPKVYQFLRSGKKHER